MAQVEAWRRCAETRLELNEGQGQDLDDLDQDNDKHHPSSSTPSTFEPSDDHWRVRGPGELSILTRFGRASTTDNHTSFPSRLTLGRSRPSTNRLQASDDDEGEEENDDFHYPMMTSSTLDSFSAMSSASLSARTTLPRQEEQSHHIQPQTAKQGHSHETSNNHGRGQRNGHAKGRKKGRRRRGRSGGNFWDHLLHRGKGNNHDDGLIDTKDGHDLDAPWDDQHRLGLEEELHRVWIRQRTHWRRSQAVVVALQRAPYAFNDHLANLGLVRKRRTGILGLIRLRFLLGLTFWSR